MGEEFERQVSGGGARSQQGLRGQMLARGSVMEDYVSKQILSGAWSPGRL